MDDLRNPYQPPTVQAYEHADNRAMVMAGKGRRFGTLIIDYLCYMVLSFAIGICVALMGPSALEALEKVPDFLIGAVVLMGYYCFFEGVWGRTPGKVICGTKVVDEAGGKPSFGQILGRSACRLIPFEAFSFFGARGWHDSIPKTYVVMVRAD